MNIVGSYIVNSIIGRRRSLGRASYYKSNDHDNDNNSNNINKHNNNDNATNNNTNNTTNNTTNNNNNTNNNNTTNNHTNNNNNNNNACLGVRALDFLFVRNLEPTSDTTCAGTDRLIR